MALDTFLARYIPALGAEMRAIVQPGEPIVAGMVGMLHYHLGWADASLQPTQAEAGKHIRPVLCLLACEACGGDWRRALPGAAAIELLHNFSLIHDDVEDQDTTRRGRPTVWALWGEAQAINAGDALFFLTQLGLLRLSESVDSATVVEAARLVNRSCLALTEGQYLDISFERRTDVSVADYLEMIERKTATLVACACELGGLIAAGRDCDPDTVRRCSGLRAFGHHLGLAFQMQDDVLGIWGDPALTGKPAGADLARRKKSLPILHGLAHSGELRTLLAQEALADDDIRLATALLEATGSRAYAAGLASEHHMRALAALDEADLAGPAAGALQELAERLLGRTR